MLLFTANTGVGVGVITGEFSAEEGGVLGAPKADVDFLGVTGAAFAPPNIDVPAEDDAGAGASGLVSAVMFVGSGAFAVVSGAGFGSGDFAVDFPNTEVPA